MSAFLEIQQLAADGSSDLPTLLRRVIVLGTRLKSEPIKRWAQSELSGYDDNLSLPKYRILKVQSFGDFASIVKTPLLGAPVTVEQLPPELSDLITTEYVLEGVEGISRSIASAVNGIVQAEWPRPIIDRYGAMIYSEMNCLKLWRAVPQKQLTGILDTIRNRVLTFVLKIKVEIPAVINSPNEGIVFRDRIEDLFETMVYGRVAVAEALDENYAEAAKDRVQKWDLVSLQKYLLEAGIPREDFDDLKKLLAPARDNRIDAHVASWMGRMVLKASNGTWKVAKPVATQILARAISRYFGSK